eukprot:UN22764
MNSYLDILIVNGFDFGYKSRNVDCAVFDTVLAYRTQEKKLYRCWIRKLVSVGQPLLRLEEGLEIIKDWHRSPCYDIDDEVNFGQKALLSRFSENYYGSYYGAIEQLSNELHGIRKIMNLESENLENLLCSYVCKKSAEANIQTFMKEVIPMRKRKRRKKSRVYGGKRSAPPEVDEIRSFSVSYSFERAGRCDYPKPRTVLKAKTGTNGRLITPTIPGSDHPLI